METANRLSGISGGPARTRQASALLPELSAAPSSGSLGSLFASEFEEASARLQDQEARTRRLDDRFDARRDARHEAFGGARRDETTPTAVPAPVANSQGPVRAPTPEPVSEPAPVATATPRSGESGGLELPAETPEGSTAPPAGVPEVTSTAPAVAAATVPASPAAAAPTAEAAAVSRPVVRAVEGAARSESTRSHPAGIVSTVRPGDTEAVERAQEILRQIKMHLAPGMRRLTLDLEPAELGRLAIQLTRRPGRLNAVVRAAEPEALRLLQEREHELRSVLAERGIQVDSMRFELGFGGRAPGHRERGAPGVPAVPVSSTAASTQAVPNSPPLPSDTLVDTYA
jgi:hypothetical protein